MNCVNCGAPPRAGAKECRHCGTALNYREPEANHAGFRGVLRAVQSFTFDDDRLAAAEHLVPRALGRGAPFEAAELFTFDDDRAAFVRLCGRHSSGADVWDDDPEVAEEGTPGSTGTGFRVGFLVVAFVVAAIVYALRG